MCLAKTCIVKNWHSSPIISANTGPVFTKCSGLIDTLVQLINLTVVLRTLKGRCYGNKLNVGANSQIDIKHLYSLHWRSTMNSNIVTPICALIAAMIQLHRVNKFQKFGPVTLEMMRLESAQQASQKISLTAFTRGHC